ncbi:MAG: monovalent cation/H+ antiporter complex subunit F [Caldilineaceae bacterium]
MLNLENLTTFELGIEILIGLMAVSLIVAFVRFFLGPDVPDRTVAFDLIAIHAVGIIALIAMRTGVSALADGAVVIAVLGFLGTVMLARYWEQSNNRGINMDLTLHEGIVLFLAALGTLFMIVSSIGVLRLPDVLARMHALGKAATLGISGLLLSLGIFFYAESGIFLRDSVGDHVLHHCTHRHNHHGLRRLPHPHQGFTRPAHR